MAEELSAAISDRVVKQAKPPKERTAHGQLTIEVMDGQVSLVFRPCVLVSDVFPGDTEGGQGQYVPPGAVGAVYGSGCFQFSRSFSVSFRSACPRTVSHSMRPVGVGCV